jgi:putative riboflavin transport system permease protein
MFALFLPRCLLDTTGFFMQDTLTQTRPTLRATQRQRSKPLLVRVAPALVVLLLLALWQLVTALRIYPAFIIPPPIDVAQKFYDVLLDGRLWMHTQVTLSAVLAGLGIGLTIGVLLGYAIARSPLLEDSLAPLIVGLQSTPIVAYAPLLVIWFGSGPTSKIVTSALIVFFPMLMSTVVGIRNVPQPLRDLMRSQRATGWQTFTKLEVPAAMPVLISGLKVSATLAVIGAVVGEFVSANAGLGFLITFARNQFDTPLVLVAVITLAIIARVLYSLVALLERRVLAWQMRTARY